MPARPSVTALTMMSAACMTDEQPVPNPYQAIGIATRKVEIVKLKRGRNATFLTSMLRARKHLAENAERSERRQPGEDLQACVSSGTRNSSAIRGAAYHIPTAASTAMTRAEKKAVATWSGRTSLRWISVGASPIP